MLRVTPSTHAGRAKSYYSTADYYTEGQELAGYWRGRGAEHLGLSGVIDRKVWDLLCDNRRPDTGGPLTPRRKGDRRVGYDFNFHCPKSVSLLYGLTRDERILEAFRDSVRATIGEIEAEVKTRVRRGGKNEDRVSGNLVYGEFTHFTARPVAGVPDPHLHMHAYAFNVTFDPQEFRWKAAQFGDIKRDAAYFEAVFHSLLARRMEELGLPTKRTRTGWELDGLGASTLSRFSRRTATIERLAKERGITDPVQKSELGALTRSGKAKELGMDELAGVWRSWLSDAESGALDSLAARVGGRTIAEDVRAVREGVDRAIAHSFECASVLPERTLLAQALKQGVGKGSRESIEAIVAKRPIVRATRDGRAMATTREVLEEESKMLAFARAGRGTCRPFDLGRKSFRRDWLNSQQKAAVRHVLESRDRVIVVRGAAGTGKSTALAELREALTESSIPVVACAPSTGAAKGVLRNEGFKSADTLSMLLANPEMQSEARDGLILVDEAGLVGGKAMRRLFDVASEQHARVLLVGDVRQHSPVERGSPLRLLETEAGLRPAEIKEIQRQRDRYKDAVRALGEGRTEEGFHRLDRLGWIREVPGPERVQALAKAYLDATRQGKSALVVSPTHLEADRITHEIRQQLRAHGLLGVETRQFARLVPTHFTLGQKRDPLAYEAGDVLIFHQNAKGYRKGQRLVVGDGPIPLDCAERYEVFRQSDLELSPGDKVRITRNGTTTDRAHRLNNGDVFTVKAFDRTGDLVLDNGWTVPKDFGHLAHGLVVTSHASQGRTVDRVFIGQGCESFPASSREQFYVSVSRAREQALVFTDNKAELLAAVSRSDERLSGTELVRDSQLHEPSILDRVRRVVVRTHEATRARMHLGQPPVGVPSHMLPIHQRQQEVNRDR